MANNLRKPPGTIPNPNFEEGSDEPKRISRPSYVLWAKSSKRLKIAAAAGRYYETIGRELTPANMHYESVLQDFREQWKALEMKCKDDDPSVPDEFLILMRNRTIKIFIVDSKNIIQIKYIFEIPSHTYNSKKIWSSQKSYH